MANLIGYVKGNRGEVSRLGSANISSRLETWEGAIKTTLRANGDYEVIVSEKNGYSGKVIATGNVHKRRVN